MENQNPSHSYLDTQIQSILANTEKTPSLVLRQMLSCMFLAAYNKGHELKILDTQSVSSLGDYFGLITVDNIAQALSLSDQILYFMKKANLTLLSREGNKDTDWILMDYGDFVIHIFVSIARERYDLDELWNSAPQVSIPEEYYLQAAHAPKKAKEENDSSLEDYI